MMQLLGNNVLLIFILTFGITYSQILSTCRRNDRTAGICLYIEQCVSQQSGSIGRTNAEFCTNAPPGRILACCRKTPELIARKKCDEWKLLANRDGSRCTVDIPLARGGVEATPGEFPHMVSILANTNNHYVHICGGILIDRRFVLTAAHCVSREKGYVRIGGHDHNVQEPSTVDAEVTEIIPHPGYQPPMKYNDIALLRVGIDVGGRFSNRVRPACLPNRGLRINAGTKLVIAGWGAYEGNRPTSNVLRKAEVTAIDRLACDTRLVIESLSTQHDYPVGITDSIICGNESVSGACQGDSGGPLMVPTSSTCEVKEVIGLVSRGIPECRKTVVPGFYTRIEYYLDWIVSTIWPDEL